MEKTKIKSAESHYLDSSLKTIGFVLRPFWGRMVLMCVLVMIGQVFSYLYPFFFKLIVDKVITYTSTPSLSAFYWPLGLIVASFLIQELFFRTAHAVETLISPKVFKHVTTNIYQGLIERPTSYFENKFSGDLGRRIEQIATSTIYFVEWFPWDAIWVLGAIIVGGVLLATTHMYMLLTLLVWFVLFVLTSIPLLRWHYRASEKVTAAHAHVSGRIVDSLSNIMLVHSFGAVRHERLLNHLAVDELVKVDTKARKIHVWTRLHQGLSVATMGISLTFMSLYLYTQGQFTVGDFALVAGVIPSIYAVVWAFGEIIIRTLKFLSEISDATLNLRENREPLLGGEIRATENAEYSIEFKNVCFQYPGTSTPVFKDFSLHVTQGEKVGIVGASGAGKSTFVKLLLRQHAKGSGNILVGGIPIEEFTLETFNSLTSYVPQDTALFHRTIFENIEYANPKVAREKVIDASKKAHADEFINELPQKYETTVGERGVKLSGGQRQRIALARAILKNAPILILDEATSSLDSQSETVIQDALTELFEGRTVIAIAHRLSTLRAMDRIIVMQNGSIIESGSPKELLAKDTGVFKEMWEHQKNGFI